MEITLYGLNKRQVVYAQTFWDCKSLEDVENFIQNLPTQIEQQEALLILELLRLEAQDQLVTAHTLHDAQAELKRIFKTH